MARHFNGATSAAYFDFDMSGGNVPGTFSCSAWIWRDNTSANKVLMEYAVNQGEGQWDVITNAFAGPSADLVRSQDNSGSWADSYPSPTINAWHHHLWVLVYGVSNSVWIDGVQQVMTSRGHDGTIGQPRLFAGDGQPNKWFVTVGARMTGIPPSVPSLWWAGKVAELTFWAGVALETRHAVALARGASPWDTHPDGLSGGVTHSKLTPDIYLPFLGVNPETSNVSNPKTVTLNATTIVNHPGVRTYRAFAGALR